MLGAHDEGVRLTSFAGRPRRHCAPLLDPVHWRDEDTRTAYESVVQVSLPRNWNAEPEVATMRTRRGRVLGGLLTGIALALAPFGSGAPAGSMGRHGVGVGEEALEKSPYLGLSAVPVDEALGCQLGLPTGVGLKVEFVDPESPAHGVLQKHDVLHRLDDQLLVSQLQLAVLVRMRQPGDTVNLTILRAGKSQTATVKLAQKELPPLRAYQNERPQSRINPPPLWMPPGAVPGWQGQPGPGADWQEGLMKSMEDGLRASRLAEDEVKRLMDEMRERLPKMGTPVPHAPPIPPVPPPQGALTPMGVGVAAGTALGSGSGVSSCQNLVVNSRAATLTTDSNGRRRLVISDGAKGVVFDGAVDTQAERAAIPAEYADLVQQLEATRAGPGGVSAPPVGPPAPAPPVH